MGDDFDGDVGTLVELHGVGGGRTSRGGGSPATGLLDRLAGRQSKCTNGQQCRRQADSGLHVLVPPCCRAASSRAPYLNPLNFVPTSSWCRNSTLDRTSSIGPAPAGTVGPRSVSCSRTYHPS